MKRPDPASAPDGISSTGGRPPGSRELTLALTADGRLAREPGRPGTHDFSVNTRQAEATADERLVYTTPPLRTDLVLAGDIAATIRASFTAHDGNIAMIVHDVAPDGTTTRVTEGWLKASHRQTHERRSQLTPGERYDIPVHVWPMHYRVGAGHRIMITVSSDDYPQIDSDAPAGEVAVAVGSRGSNLTITTVPARHARGQR